MEENFREEALNLAAINLDEHNNETDLSGPHPNEGNLYDGLIRQPNIASAGGNPDQKDQGNEKKSQQSKRIEKYNAKIVKLRSEQLELTDEQEILRYEKLIQAFTNSINELKNSNNTGNNNNNIYNNENKTNNTQNKKINVPVFQLIDDSASTKADSKPSYENAETFVTASENIMIANDVNIKVDWKKYLAASFMYSRHDEYLKFYNSRITKAIEVQAEWNTVKYIIIDRFGNSNNIVKNITLFPKAHQGKTELIRDYVHGSLFGLEKQNPKL